MASRIKLPGETTLNLSLREHVELFGSLDVDLVEMCNTEKGDDYSCKRVNY
jgi:hypothetical protein